METCGAPGRLHAAQMLPRLELSEKDRKSVAITLRGYLKDRSGIVKTFARQGLADLATQDFRLPLPIRRVGLFPHQNGQSGDEKPGAQAPDPIRRVRIAPSCLSFKIDTVQDIRHI